MVEVMVKAAGLLKEPSALGDAVGYVLNLPGNSSKSKRVLEDGGMEFCHTIYRMAAYNSQMRHAYIFQSPL